MKIPPYRLHHLYALWQKYLSNWPLLQADRWIYGEFKTHKSFGKKDRAFYADMLFAGIRHALLALACQEAQEGKWQPESQSIEKWAAVHKDASLVWKKIRAMPPETFFKWIQLRLSEEPGTHGLMAWLSNQPSLTAKLLWHSLPFQYHSAFGERFSKWSPEESARFLAAQQVKAPLWIRIKQPDCEKPVRQELKTAGFSIIAEQSLNRHLALAIAGERGIYELESYKEGLFEIQDLASQYIGDAIEISHKKPVMLDACAGGGGKTMQLAAMLHNQGVLYACDIREYKLDEIKRRAKKGRFSNIRTFTWDWTQESLPTFSREVEKNQGFDAVLVDAPCSSSGTWRRNPDAKWRFDLNELPALTNLQATILNNAAKVLKKGGSLVYSTCSFLVDENELIVKDFLNKHQDFSLAKCELLGLPRHDSDTMFVAVLTKNLA